MKTLFVVILIIISLSSMAQGLQMSQQPISDQLEDDLSSNSGGKVGSGGDGLALSTPFLWIFSDRKVELLDLAEHGYNENSVHDYKTLNPAIKRYNENFDYVNNKVCLRVKLNNTTCNGLINKMFDIYRFMPEYYRLMKNKMIELDWLSVEVNEEVHDEGNTIKGVVEKAEYKFQLVKREDGVVNIQEQGWIEKFKKIYPIANPLTKIATITHEIIGDIVRKQGDETTERVRKVNSLLYQDVFQRRLEESYKLLTGKFVASKNLLIDKKELAWMLEEEIAETLNNRKSIHNFVIVSTSSYSQERSLRPRFYKETTNKVLEKIYSTTNFFGMMSKDYSRYNYRASGIKVSERYRKVLSNYTNYNYNILRMKVRELANLFANMKYYKFDDFKKDYKEKLINELKISLDKIPLCKNSKRIKVPKSMLIGHNSIFHSWGIESVGDYLTELPYYIITTDKYLDSPNLCVKYSSKDGRNKSSYTIKLIDNRFVDLDGKIGKEPLSIIHAVKLSYNRKSKKHFVNGLYTIRGFDKKKLFLKIERDDKLSK